MSKELSEAIQSALADRFGQAATIGGQHYRITPGTKGYPYFECRDYLIALDARRQIEKGKQMSDDHLKQEAVKWFRALSEGKRLIA